MKKILALVLSLVFIASLSSAAFASESKSPYELPYDVNTGKMFSERTSSEVTLPGTRAIWGYGRLYHHKPLLSKPQAYAYTEAIDTAYKVRAKCDVNNNGESTETTGWRELLNTKTCNSGTIKAKTNVCVFDGFHEIQKTSTSGVGTAQTTASYS